ncbi:hypothetical protein HK100_002687 [Physocladia obscura]|uniref:LIM zinc-binding domain-containing protein n=1 Tax=Physocladia obscura TaxID=109957 RepID=A0AAD5T9U1_9FUNG|nr:hypothetical protein HK100_002687 [Physocladia obscura]
MPPSESPFPPPPQQQQQRQVVLDNSNKNGSAGESEQEAGVRTCTHCGRPITGQSVRALNFFFHVDCFKCAECSIPVADKFFPFFPQTEGEDPSQQSQSQLSRPPVFYCETDFFAKHGLLCAKCGGALRGPHINAIGKKFHLDHFSCNVEECGIVFRQHDAFYERDGKCGGCQTAVIKKFVEMRKDGILYQWHPQCYMVYKVSA